MNQGMRADYKHFLRIIEVQEPDLEDSETLQMSLSLLTQNPLGYCNWQI